MIATTSAQEVVVSQSLQDLPKYTLITPARNEVEFIELTINSVLEQTFRPVKWLIVSDGSTDGTDTIVKKYAAQYSWIDLIQMPGRRDRHFAGKAYAVNAAYSTLKELRFDVVGNLDADVTFEDRAYFAFIMGNFLADPTLGVAGTSFQEGQLTYNYEFVGVEHVSGMCQLFRRECFEAIGGYPAIPSGGIDVIAVLSARAGGWRTETFLDKSFVHHRKQGTAQNNSMFFERLHMGRKDYLLGNHPAWEICRSFYQMRHKPYIVGGLLILCSYLWSSLLRVTVTMPENLRVLRRTEQLKRLKSIVTSRLRGFYPSSKHSA